MSYSVIIEERAKSDIREAARWMAQYSPRKALTWHFEIEEAVLSLENNPLRCPLAPEYQFFHEEIRQLIFEKYRILFVVKDEEVHVLYVRHSARDYVRPEADD
jgi:plasmid stabilization system protein ParE